jgi:two-component system, sporulation sensor kinase A
VLDKLLQDKLFYLSAFDHSLIGMAFLTIDGRWMRVNPSLCKIVGYTETELLNMTFQDITHPDDLEIGSDCSLDLLEGRADHYQIEKKYIHKCGFTIWVQVSISLIRDDQGKPLVFFSQTQDITEMKKEREKLMELEKLHRLISDNSKDILYYSRADSEVRYVSPAIKKILGYDPDELVGKSGLHLWHPADLENYLSYRKSKEGVCTCRVRHKDGQYIWFEIQINIVRNESGQTEDIIAVARDITEQKQTEEMLKRSEQLSMVGELAAGIAHEIRNPLTSLRGFVQLFQSEDVTRAKKMRHEVMLSEIDRINEIVSELLVLSKPANETYGFGNIVDKLNHVVTLFEGQANLYNIQILKEYDSDIPAIKSHNSLKQVFVNILKNGIESMSNGGEMFIQVTMVNDNVCIRCQDQGCGIPKDQIEKIGTPFYTTKESGIGLGFMVSQRIIQNHKGTMRIESEEGRGTTVEILLPVN